MEGVAGGQGRMAVVVVVCGLRSLLFLSLTPGKAVWKWGRRREEEKAAADWFIHGWLSPAWEGGGRCAKLNVVQKFTRFVSLVHPPRGYGRTPTFWQQDICCSRVSTTVGSINTYSIKKDSTVGRSRLC